MSKISKDCKRKYPLTSDNALEAQWFIVGLFGGLCRDGSIVEVDICICTFILNELLWQCQEFATPDNFVYLKTKKYSWHDQKEEQVSSRDIILVLIKC